MTGEGTSRGLGTSLIGATLSSRYRLESKLGSGGMSTVYLAHDETLERWVAVKVLHAEMSDQPEQLERFRRESTTVAQISHPNVVAVIDAGDDSGHPYIVFEYVNGETLKQRIERMGRLPLDEAAAYAIEVGRGLQAAHVAHMVHRDVKPQNVLIDGEGRGKVTDFGIALSLESDGLTKTGRVLGTTDYVSPEQALGREIDARSDIYSLGILLYEMVTGDVPFKAETLVGVAMKHVNDPVPDVQRIRPEVSSQLAAVIERSAQKQPRKRYPDMAAMLNDLQAALEVEAARAGGAHGEATSVLATIPERTRMLGSRRVSAAGIVLVLAGVIVALLLIGIGENDGKGERQASNSTQSTTTPDGTGAELTLANPFDFDPDGDQVEHSEQVDLAIDGNPESGWTTEIYKVGPALTDAADKPGVGIVVEAPDAAAASQLVVASSTPGWSGAVYGAAGSVPETLEGWGEPIATISDAEARTTVEMGGATDGYYLIWITSLAETDSGYEVAINDLALFG